jgi:hypothetical protein
MKLAKSLATLGATGALTLGSVLLAAPAQAQPRQEGLVNVNIEDVNVQIPIGVAANVCGVTVAVLAELPPGATFDCEAGTVQELPVAFRP